MTTTIQISKEAVEHLAVRAALDLGEAEELISELFSMCVIDSQPDNRAGELEMMVLRKTARTLLAYYDKHGAREFHRHFGTKDVSGERLIEFLGEFLQEGDPSKPAHPA